MVEQIQSIMGMFGSVSKGASGAMGKLNPASLMDTMVAWFMQFKDIGFTIGFIGNICLIYMMYIVLKEIAKQIAFASKMKKLQGKQVKERSDNPLYNIKLINDLRTAIYKRKKSKGKEAGGGHWCQHWRGSRHGQSARAAACLHGHRGGAQRTPTR